MKKIIDVFRRLNLISLGIFFPLGYFGNRYFFSDAGLIFNLIGTLIFLVGVYVLSPLNLIEPKNK